MSGASLIRFRVEIWEVTEGPAEEYDETEGEDGEGDAVAALLQLAQWELVE